jgi:hypothetical protein
MGAVLRNVGNAVDCGYTALPGSSIVDNQVTAGLTGLTIACASVIEPGPDDTVLFYNTAGTLVLAGLAKIELAPLEEGAATPGARLESPALEPVPDPSLASGVKGGPVREQR